MNWLKRIFLAKIGIPVYLLLVVVSAVSAVRLLPAGVFQPKYRLRTYLSEAEGLRVGAPVRLDGFDVGKVEAIRLVDVPPGTRVDPNRRIEVVMEIRKRYQSQVRDDSAARLVTQGLFGDRDISISRGLFGAPLPVNGEVRGQVELQLTLKDLIEAEGKFADCISQKARTH
jgi:phospholipid/cholesterol/gamma-HCH transport system substrate-binding protein